MPPPPVPLRSSSVDAGPRFTAQQKGKGKDDGTNGTGIQNVPLNANVSQTNGDGGQEKYGLGPRPVLDVAKAEELCGIEEGGFNQCFSESLAVLRADFLKTNYPYSVWKDLQICKINWSRHHLKHRHYWHGYSSSKTLKPKIPKPSQYLSAPSHSATCG